MANKPLRFHPQAEQEYLTSLAYRERSLIAAINFENAFEEAVGRIREAPAMANLLQGFSKIYPPAISLQHCLSGFFF